MRVIRFCKATTNKGTPCKTTCLSEEDFCLFHSQSDRAKELRNRGKATRRVGFGRIRITSQTDVVHFLELYMEQIGSTGVSITPQMTKSLADLTNAYISLHELAMEQSAINKTLEPVDQGEGEI